MYPKQVKGLVTLAEECIRTIGNAKGKDRLAFGAWIMFDRTGGVKEARSRARAVDPTALFPEKRKK